MKPPQRMPASAYIQEQSSSDELQQVMKRMAENMGKISLANCNQNEDAWQFTYLDVITLLFAVFVLLLALYGNQVSKQRAVMEGMKAKETVHRGETIDRPGIAFERTIRPAPKTPEKIAARAPEKANEKTEPESKKLEQDALKKISERIASKGLGDVVTVKLQKGGVTITMKETLLFPSGEAALSAQGTTWLREITPAIQPDVESISVEGHTDNLPINTGKFPSNWELSAGRASSVVRELIAAGISSDKLRAIGYADTRPIGYNAFPSGREQNRRVQIKLNYSRVKDN